MQSGSETIRPRPAKLPSKEKFELCSMLPNCRRGERCTFAHSEAEMLVWNGFRPSPKIEPYGGTYNMCMYYPDCKKERLVHLLIVKTKDLNGVSCLKRSLILGTNLRE